MGWRLLFSGLERLAMTAVGYVAHHSDDHAHMMDLLGMCVRPSKFPDVWQDVHD